MNITIAEGGIIPEEVKQLAGLKVLDISTTFGDMGFIHLETNKGLKTIAIQTPKFYTSKEE